jgi:predicted dienelactone hydrolase
VLGGTASGDVSSSVTDLLQTLDLMTAEDQRAGGPFAAHVDTDRVAAVGHSAGGFTVIGAALDPRIDGYVSMASGKVDAAAAYPTVPGLFLAGATDGVVPVDAVTKPAFAGAPSPSWFAQLASTGHNGFDDFCTFGNGTGVIGLAEASGLGPLLDAQPQLRTLGEDGCLAPAAPVEQAFPIIRHATTAFLEYVFGTDAAPAIGPELDGAYELAVTTESH